MPLPERRIKDKANKLMDFVLENCIHIMKDGHLHRLLLCIMYATFKAMKKLNVDNIEDYDTVSSFSRTAEWYHGSTLAKSDVNQVIGDEPEPLCMFYNRVFLPVVKDKLLKISVHMYFGYNFGCDSTEALYFDVDSTNKYLVGIVFNNIQIQSYGLTNATRNAEEFKGLPYFSTKTIDCEPTFSAGSWMGIVVTLVLVTVLMFGYLMLNSVQTMDRFDDPKQKQIVINIKE